MQTEASAFVCLRRQAEVGAERFVPFGRIRFSVRPGVQLLFCVILGIDRMHGVVKQAEDFAAGGRAVCSKNHRNRAEERGFPIYFLLHVLFMFHVIVPSLCFIILILLRRRLLFSRCFADGCLFSAYRERSPLSHFAVRQTCRHVFLTYAHYITDMRLEPPKNRRAGFSEKRRKAADSPAALRRFFFLL